ncbi:histidine kinase [Streptomyces badius]
MTVSGADGGGAVFTVVLPEALAAPSAEPPAGAPHPTHPATTGEQR